MKKNYLIVCLVQAFIIIELVVLFPVTASSQDLTVIQWTNPDEGYTYNSEVFCYAG